MTTFLEQVKLIVGPVLAAIALLGSVSFAAWVRGVNIQRKRNAFNALNNETEKIHIDVQSKPLDDLVSESNLRHGAKLVEPTGTDDQEE